MSFSALCARHPYPKSVPTHHGTIVGLQCTVHPNCTCIMQWCRRLCPWNYFIPKGKQLLSTAEFSLQLTLVLGHGGYSTCWAPIFAAPSQNTHFMAIRCNQSCLSVCLFFPFLPLLNCWSFLWFPKLIPILYDISSFGYQKLSSP